jgi:hypothetical protein
LDAAQHGHAFPCGSSHGALVAVSNGSDVLAVDIVPFDCVVVRALCARSGGSLSAFRAASASSQTSLVQPQPPFMGSGHRPADRAVSRDHPPQRPLVHRGDLETLNAEVPLVDDRFGELVVPQREDPNLIPRGTQRRRLLPNPGVDVARVEYKHGHAHRPLRNGVDSGDRGALAAGGAGENAFMLAHEPLDRDT